ncbi:hypothetical protein FWG76_01980, partial [Candidatus Saccharibacteria bacterium]|nr:hypothetical protein [Candidatus Saccharibacteria bacterium]
MMALTGCHASSPEAVANTISVEQEAFYGAASNETKDWGYTTSLLTQVEGGQAANASSMLLKDLKRWAEQEGWQFVSNTITADSQVFFVNGGTIETVTLSGTYPVARNGGILYVAERGRVYQIPAKQPDQTAVWAMQSLMQKWGDSVEARVTPTIPASVEQSETIFGRIGTNLWGDQGLWQFLTEGHGSWRPEIIGEGAETKVYAPGDLSGRLSETERLLFTIGADGSVVVPEAAQPPQTQTQSQTQTTTTTTTTTTATQTQPPQQQEAPPVVLPPPEPTQTPAQIASAMQPIAVLQDDDLYKSLTQDERETVLQRLVDQIARENEIKPWAIQVMPDSHFTPMSLAYASLRDRRIALRESSLESSDEVFEKWFLTFIVLHEATHMVHIEYIFNNNGNGAFLEDTDLFGSDPELTLKTIKENLSVRGGGELYSEADVAVHHAKLSEYAADVTSLKFMEQYMPRDVVRIDWETRSPTRR